MDSFLLRLFRRRPAAWGGNAPIQLVPATLPAGTVGEEYPAVQIRYTGGTPGGEVAFSVIGGTGGGITLSQTGVTGGSPLTAGTVSLQVVIRDIATGTTATLAYSIRSDTPVVLTQTAAPGGLTGQAWSYTFVATGGRGAYTFQNTLPVPAGYSWSASTGVLSRASPTAGSPTFAARAIDSDGRQSAVLTINWSIRDDVVINQIVVDSSDEGETCVGTVTFSGPLDTQVFVVTGPPGMTVDPDTGALGGTLGADGVYETTFRAYSASANDEAFRTISITVYAAAAIPVITTSALDPATVGVTYRFQMECDTPLCTWEISGTTTGFTVEPSTGLFFSSQPTVVGLFTATFVAISPLGVRSAPVSLQYRTANPVVANNQTLAETAVGEAYSVQIAATGGYGALTYTTTATDLRGLTLGSTGIVSGPATAVAYPIPLTFTVIVTDTQNRTDTAQITIEVTSPITISTPNLPQAQIGVFYDTTVGASGGDEVYTFAKVGATPSWATVDTVNNQARIYGNPSGSDTTLTITVDDTSGAPAVQRSYPLTVLPAATEDLQIAPTMLEDMVVSTPVPSIQLVGSGGSGSYTFTKRPDSVTSWLNVTSAGLLYGMVTSSLRTPISSPGFGVRMTDTVTGLYVDRYWIFNTIAAVTVVITTPTTLPSVLTGTTSWAPVTLAASGGTGPYINWTRTGGTAPAGLVIDSGTGAITWPTVGTVGNYTMIVTVQDSAGHTSAATTFNVQVNPTAVTITAATLSHATVGVQTSYLFQATGGQPPYANWTVTDGALPLSMTLSTDSVGRGVLSGPPDTDATYDFTLQCEDDLGTLSATRAFQLIVDEAPVVVVGDDYAYRTGGARSMRMGDAPRTTAYGAVITQAQRFDSAAEVTPFSHNGSTAHLRWTDNPGWALPPGQIGVMEMEIPADSGNADVRGISYWSAGVNYQVAQLTPGPDNNTARRINSRVYYQGTSTNAFRALQASGPDTPAGPQTPPGNENSNAYWEWIGSQGSLTTGDSNANYSRRLRADHEEFGTSYRGVTDLGPGDTCWIQIRQRLSREYTRASYLHNSGSGGPKNWMLATIHESNPTGQQAFGNTAGHENVFCDHIQGGNPNSTGTGYWAFEADNLPSPSPGTAWVDGANSPYSDSGNWPLQEGILNLTAAQHPVTKHSYGAIVVDPNEWGTDGSTMTVAQRRIAQIRKHGHLHELTLSAYDAVTGMTSSDLPRSYTNDDGGMLLSRDYANDMMTVLLRFRFGTNGNPDSYFERWEAKNGFDYVFIRGGNCRLRLRDAENGGNPIPAYGNQGPPDAGTDQIGFQAIVLCGADTARVEFSNEDPEAGPYADVKWWPLEYNVAFGPIGIPAPGFTVPPQSRDPDAAVGYVPAPGVVVTMPDSLNGNDTPVSVNPADMEADTSTLKWGQKFWCSQAFSCLIPDYHRGRMWSVATSGHSCGINDMIMCWDQNGDDTGPLGFVRYYVSPIASLRGGQDVLPDGTVVNPGGVPEGSLFENVGGQDRLRGTHRYGGCVAADGRIFTFPGAPNVEGGGAGRALLSFNPSTLAAVSHGSAPYAGSTQIQTAAPVCAFADDYNVVIGYHRGSGLFMVFNAATDTYVTNWTGTRNAGSTQSPISPALDMTYGAASDRSSLCYVPGTPTRPAQLLVFGDASWTGVHRPIGTFNGSVLTPCNTVTWQNTGGGAADSALVTLLFSGAAPGCHWDPEWNGGAGCIWFMPLDAPDWSDPSTPDQSQPNRGRLLRLRPVSATPAPGGYSVVWSIEDVSSALSGESIITSYNGSIVSSLPRLGYGKIMPWIGNNALIVADGTRNDRLKLIGKPA